MRIVHIYKDYFPVFGGIENHIKTLAEAQAAHGHEVTVLVTQIAGQKSAIENLHGVRVVKMTRQLNVQSAPISAQFAAAVGSQTRGADIAHLHAPYPIGEACNLWFGRAKKTVISWHSDIVRQKTLLQVYAPVLRRVVAKVDHIIASSEPYARTSPWISAYADKTTVVPYGIDASRFLSNAHAAEADQLRQSLLAQHPDCNFIALGVGRMRYYKGFNDFISAVAKTPDVLGVLVGIGPMEAELRAQAEESGAANRLMFAGEIDDAHLPQYYHAADAYVLSSNSRAEAFGIVLLEAMASGLPLVTTELGTATSWVNVDDVTGYVVPPLNPGALASAINKLREPDTRRRMGVASRDRLLSEFTQARMIERVEAVYRGVLG